jgi:hypothetical protein
MGAIVLNGTTVTDYNAGVTANNTAITEVFFNGTKYWSRYPYPPGTDVFTFQYCPSGNLFDINSYVSAHPLVFSGAPYISAGNPSGSPDSIMYVPINPGFQVVNVNNAERGVFAVGTNVGSSFSIGMYRTFTTFYGDVTSFGGNGCTSFTMRYVGN